MKKHRKLSLAQRYTVELVSSGDLLKSAQRLRDRYFFSTSGYRDNSVSQILDKQSSHIVVIDTHEPVETSVVGTLRLTEVKSLKEGALSTFEKNYDIDRILSNSRNPLELSRFCVKQDRRSGAVLLMIWRYALDHIKNSKYDVVLGSVSFSQAEIKSAGGEIYRFYQKFPDHEEIIRAKDGVKFIDVETFSKLDSYSSGKQHPLLRGYMNLGARMGKFACFNKEFGTILVPLFAKVTEIP